MKKNTFSSNLSIQYLWSIPNVLTLLRILVTPCIAYFFMSHNLHAAFGLFVLAAITDFCDGFFARLLNQETPFGAFLDACADKLLILTCFVSLLYIKYGTFPGIFPFVMLLITKELVQFFGFSLLWVTNKPPRIQPTMTAKISTSLQMIIIFWLFFIHFFDSFSLVVHYMLVSISSFFVVASLVQYSLIGYSRLFAKEII